MIFDFKMLDSDGIFRRKARYVACGHTTENPADLTYASVVSQDSIWTVAGPEFGSDTGKIFIINMSLYGLK